MFVSKHLDLSKQAQIDRLVKHCQHLHDVAFDLDIKKDKDRIKVIDQTISDLKMQINSLKVHLAEYGNRK